MQLKQSAALVACALLFAGLAGAQDPPQRPNSRPSSDEAVKTILDLSEAQLQELRDLRSSVNQQRQANRVMLRHLQQQQRELLQATPPDALALADILVQQENLRKQIEDENKAFREAALNLLTASQKEKVQAIQDAMQLARDGRPLAQFGLIENLGGAGGPGGAGGLGFAGRDGARFQGQVEAPAPPPQP